MKKWLSAALAMLLSVPALAEGGEGVADAVSTVETVAAVAQKEIPTWFVCAMGMGIVFIGLICLIVLIKILGKVSELVASKETAPAPVATAAAPAAAPAADVIPNRGELVAAVSAALAEELGTDVTAIRIVSIKRV